jgi:uncharacterized cupin superfamily protein
VADRPSNVVGEGDFGWSEQRHGKKFGHRRKPLGSTAGGQRVGCSLYEVEPGRAAFPRHYRLANEEAIYVLEGSGTLRLGRERRGGRALAGRLRGAARRCRRGTPARQHLEGGA